MKIGPIHRSKTYYILVSTSLRSAFLTLFFIAAAFFMSGSLFGAIIYVDSAATCPGTGASWGTAYCDLQTGIAASGAGDTIWVADGTYFPTTGTSRNVAFELKAGVKIFGGFAGGETSISQRDPQTNITRLSGDIGTSGSISDNSFQVVLIGTGDANAELDGFFISGGNANGSGTRNRGGGMYIDGTGPTFGNLVVENNEASFGGGIYLQNFNSIIANSIIRNNAASSSGGGIYFSGSFTTLTGSTIEGNTSGTTGGGGLYITLSSQPLISDCYVIGNISARDGAGLKTEGSANPYTIYTTTFLQNSSARFGGASYNNFGANVDYINCVFVENEAVRTGGAVHNRSNTSNIIHCTFYLNEAERAGGSSFTGGAVYQENGVLNLKNSICWGNLDAGNDVGPTTEVDGTGTLNITNSIVQDNVSGGTVFNFDPQFLDANGPDGIPGTLDDDLRLAPCGPAVDTGAVDTNLIDRVGNVRPFDGNQDGNAKPDPGAFESIIPGVPPTIAFDNTVYGCGVNISCNGGSDGTASVANIGGTYLWNTGATASSVSGLMAGDYFVTYTDSLGCVNTDTTTLTEPSPISVDSFSRSVYGCGFNVSCNGGFDGEATVFPSGGCPPFSFLWSNGDTSATAKNLSAGTHSVTITDQNGCVFVDSVTLTEPTLLVSSGINPTIQGCGHAISCNGGSDGVATATASGGCPPYSFLWSNGDTTATATNLSAGTHSVTITDQNGCTTTDTILLTEPDLLLVSGFNTSLFACGYEISCFGASDGSAMVNLNGGCPPYNYLWSTGDTTASISGQTAGTYSVMVTDANGCMTSDSVELQEPAPVKVDSTSLSLFGCGVNISCNGGSNGTAGLVASGGCMPYAYLWSNGDTSATAGNLSAGLTTVTLTDANGCQVSDSVNLIEPDPLVMDSLVAAETSPGFNVTCSGATDGSATAYPSGGCAPYSFLWSNGDTTQTADSLSDGPAIVTITDANGCSRMDTVNLVAPVTIQIDSLLLGTYACGTNVSCPAATDGSASVFASGGSLPYSFLWSTGDTTSSVSGLGATTYTITVTDNLNCSVDSAITLSAPTPVQVDSFAVSQYNCGFGVTCFGAADGMATAFVSGGCAPYSFLWVNGDTTSSANGLAGGPSFVSISDQNGCLITDTVALSEPSPVQVDSMIASTGACGDNISCNGGSDGSVTAFASGGCPGYSFSWSNGDTTVTANNLPAGAAIVTATDQNGCPAQDTIVLTEPSPLLVDSLQTSNYNCGFNISCNGGNNGSVKAHVSGGCAPYQYSWNTGASTDSISGLSAGTYIVTITDANSCVTIDSITLTEPALLSANLGTSQFNCGFDVSCNGFADGYAFAAPTGGCAPFTYTWNTGATSDTLFNLGAGSVNVFISDANGCFAFESITLNEPPALVIDSLVVDTFNCGFGVSCFGLADGAATVFGSGGCAPYAYSWSNGDTVDSAVGLTAGTVQILLTDQNGCTAQDSAQLIEPAPLTIDSLVALTYACGENISCNGMNDGEVTALVSGGCANYFYSWSSGGSSPVESGLGAGMVHLTVQDQNGCSALDSVTLVEPLPLQATDTVSPVLCNGGNDGSISLSVNGGAVCGNYQFAWTGPNAYTSTQQNITNLFAGTYTYTITDTHGCQLSGPVQVAEPTALTLQFAVNDESCTGREDGTIQAFAMGGTPGYSYLWSNGDTTTQQRDLPGGTYVISVTDSNGCQVTDSTVVGTSPASTNMINSVGPPSVCRADTLELFGDPGYVSYQWSTGDTTESIEVDTGGVYILQTVDVTGCQHLDTLSVPYIDRTDPNPLVVPVGPVNLCQGDSIYLDAGAGYFSYEWNTGFTGQVLMTHAAGAYTVMVFNGFGCSEVSDTVFVNGVPAATPPVITQSGDTLFASTADNWQWYLNSQPISGATDSFFVPLGSGDYYVETENEYGCTAMSNIISFAVGLQPGVLTGLELYPNPTRGSVVLSSQTALSGEVRIQLRNQLGVLLRDWNLNGLSGAQTLGLERLSSGVYFVMVVNDGRRMVRKLVVE